MTTEHASVTSTNAKNSAIPLKWRNRWMNIEDISAAYNQGGASKKCIETPKRAII